MTGCPSCKVKHYNVCVDTPILRSYTFQMIVSIFHLSQVLAETGPLFDDNVSRDDGDGKFILVDSVRLHYGYDNNIKHVCILNASFGQLH
jgi:hypothetical protein